jgi:gamma-glutamyltranspeptidase / glutathione hydrolase
MRSAWRSPSWMLGLALGAGLFSLAPGGQAEVEAVVPAATKAVATEHALSTQAAIDCLKRGGNAADAAVAAALAAGVVAPTSSGLGGGGFAMVLKAGAAAPELVDFRETAPAGVDRDALARRPLPPEQRGKLVGVPGEPQGLFDLVRRFGRRPFADAVLSAQRFAERGFPVSDYLSKALVGRAAASGELEKEPSLSKLFFPGGKPAIAGRIVRNPKLASTLKRLAAEGPQAIYDGAIAAEISATVASAGGVLTSNDLKGYRVLDRRPIRANWADHVVYTMPPPSAGGILLAQVLGLFEPAELEKLGWGSGPFIHLLAEAFRASFADRFRYIADPAFVPVDTDRLFARARLSQIRKQLSIDRTHAVQRFVVEEHGTHHLVVEDGDGMVVSLTTTVNSSFGAKLVTANSGIVLNDQLNDFNKPSDYANYGLPHGPNLPRPGARPTSSMTPTIVLRGGRPVLAVGGSGGMTISTNVTQLLLGRLLFERTPAELVNEPRFYLGPRGALWVDPTMPPAVVNDLLRRGEPVETSKFLTHGVQMIAGEPAALQAAADPRKQGAAQTLP